MKAISVEIADALLVELDLHRDERGFFVERFNRARFQEHGLPVDFVQDNQSRSKAGVVRGLHVQLHPPQGKLVGAVRGAIWDVLLDLRPGSSTFGRHAAYELSDENARLLWIPPGVAHGFCVLGDGWADVLYKVTAPYNPRGESGVRWNDTEVNIDWPVKDPTSARDMTLPTLDYRKLFLGAR